MNTSTTDSLPNGGPVDEAVWAILTRADITPLAKVLILILTIKGEAMTSQALGELAGVKYRQVDYALGPWIKRGLVRLTKTPNFEAEKFVRTFSINTEPTALSDSPID